MKDDDKMTDIKQAKKLQTRVEFQKMKALENSKELFRKSIEFG